MISMMLNNGAIRWEVPIGEPRGATELERIADVSGVPAIYGQGVVPRLIRDEWGVLTS